MPTVVVGLNDPEIVELPAIELPGNLDGRYINFEAHDGNEALKRTADALTNGHKAFTELNELRANPFDEDRAATHARKVRERYNSTQDAWSQNVTRVETELASELTAVEAELSRAANLKADSRYEGSILNKLIAMTPADQTAFIGQLITDGDGPSLAAVLDAPSALTGLTAERKAELKTAHCAKSAPKQVALRDAIMAAQQHVRDTSIAMLRLAPTMLQWTAPGEWKLRAKKAAAERAGMNDATFKA